MNKKAYVVLCTCPSEEVAKALATKAVESRLAACVNIIPGLTSIYTWQDKLETANESLLLIKTTADAFPKLEALLLHEHPYECPEVIGLNIEHGTRGYLQWIEKTVLTA